MGLPVIRGEKATHLALQPQEFTILKMCTGARLPLVVLHGGTKPSEQLQRFFVFKIRQLMYTPMGAAHSSDFFEFARSHINSSLCSSVTPTSKNPLLLFFLHPPSLFSPLTSLYFLSVKGNRGVDPFPSFSTVYSLAPQLFLATLHTLINFLSISLFSHS